MPIVCVCENLNSLMLNHETCLKCQNRKPNESLFLIIQKIFLKEMFIYCYNSFFPDAWYVMSSGSDTQRCGREETPCESLLYLLQQVNHTHLPPDKIDDIDNRTPALPSSARVEIDNQTYPNPSSSLHAGKQDPPPFLNKGEQDPPPSLHAGEQDPSSSLHAGKHDPPPSLHEGEMDPPPSLHAGNYGPPPSMKGNRTHLSPSLPP